MRFLSRKSRSVKLFLCFLFFSCFIFFIRYWINNPCLNILVECHCTLNTNEPLVLLTFDDGPHSLNTPAILDVLKKHNIFALFFVNGNKFDQRKDIARRVVAEGHQLVNHSFAHDALIFKSYQTIKSDLHKTDSLILEAGQQQFKFFRPPYGKTFINLPRVLKNQNRQILGWSVAPPAQFDTDFNPQKVLDQILDNLHPGAILLLHDGTDNVSPEELSILLERLITEVENRKYRFILKGENFETYL